MVSRRAQSLFTFAGAVGTAWMLGCTNPMDSAPNTQTLSMSLAGKADSAGGEAGKTTICHFPPGNPANPHSITVGNPSLLAHLAHGDKLGACKDMPPADPRPCSDGSAKGRSHTGMAPNRSGSKVTICHIPPGNPANAQTIVVGAAAVKAHLAHGDKPGACTEDSESLSVSVDCDGNDSGKGHGDSIDGGTQGTDEGASGAGRTNDPPSDLNF